MTTKRNLTRYKKITLVPGIIETYTRYRLAQPLVRQPFLPRSLVLFVTYFCNAQCIMCGIWKNNAASPRVSELLAGEWDPILADPLFREIENLNINGGEFTLRNDLAEVIQTAINRLARLKRISMVSNGLMTDQLIRQVEQVRHICVENKIAFSISISMHGLYEVEDQIYGMRGAFDKQLASISGLQEMAAQGNLELGLSCVIMNDNAMNLRSLLQWCQAQDLTIRFSVVEKRMRFNNLAMEDVGEISGEDKDGVIEFLQDLAHDKGLFKPSAYVYNYLVDLLRDNQERRMSCDYILGAVILGSHGELFYCPHDEAIGNCRDRSAYEIFYDPQHLEHRKNSLIQQKCSHCPPKDYGTLAIQADVFQYLRFLMDRNHR